MWFEWRQLRVTEDEEEVDPWAPPPIFFSGSGAFEYLANAKNEPILEFKGNAIGSPMAAIRADAFVKRVVRQDEFSEPYLHGSLPGDAVVIPAHDCCGCRIMLWGDQLLFIMRYPQPAIRGLIDDDDGSVAPGPTGGFSIGGSCLQMGIR
jgi:hypothetical protein